MCFIILLVLSLAPDSLYGQETKTNGESLSVGSDAPNWEMTGSDGKKYRLADFKGKKMVVVAWYPMALTGG